VPTGKWPLRALLVASPFGIIALESGWLVTEFGRQPWIVQGYMRVAEGATPSAGIDVVFLVFLLVYIALTVGLLKMLLWPSPGKKKEEPHAGT
jgi:cytochrome d ubiquinol oxidase subunit I